MKGNLDRRSKKGIVKKAHAGNLGEDNRAEAFVFE